MSKAWVFGFLLFANAKSTEKSLFELRLQDETVSVVQIIEKGGV
jgi:hypothetical protein